MNKRSVGGDELNPNGLPTEVHQRPFTAKGKLAKPRLMILGATLIIQMDAPITSEFQRNGHGPDEQGHYLRTRRLAK